MDNSYHTNKIAVLLAGYNGASFIEEQIGSILRQTEKEWELFIHDDGSSDETPAICKTYAEKYPDKIHLLEGAATGGAKNNFFFLLQKVRAPYYMFCDQDDVWKEEKIAHTFQKMKETEEALPEEPSKPVLVFTDLAVADRDLNLIAESMNLHQSLDPSRTALSDLILQNCITGCTVMINEALAGMMRRPCDLSKIIMHDWWAGLIAARFGTIAYLPESTILYRQHGSNSLGAYKVTSIQFLREKLSNNEIHESLKETQIQTGEFRKAFQLEDEMLNIYADLYSLPKSERRAFYRKYGLHMNGTLRNLGLKLFG